MYSFSTICIACQVEYRPEKIGVTVIEMASFGPYKIWQADLKKCPGCGHLVVSNFAEKATDHHEPEFAEILKRTLENGAYLLLERPIKKGE